MRGIALLLFSLSLTLLLGQRDRYQYQLQLDTEAQILKGSLRITMKAGRQALDTAYLHLPPRSLEWEGSFLNRQLLEFQNPRLYFAEPEERGSITVEKLLVNGNSAKACHSCEFVALLLPGFSETDSTFIELDFVIHLPPLKWIGTGAGIEEYRIIDWLPRLAPRDSSGFHLYPVTWQRDVYPLPHQYEVELELPSYLSVASNARLTSADEIHRLDSLAANPYANLLHSPGVKNLHFTHEGAPLTFLIAPYRVFPLPDGSRLFTLNDDPRLPLYFNRFQQEVNQFLQAEAGLPADDPKDIVVVDQKISEYQSDELLVIDLPQNKLLALVDPQDDFDLVQNLVQARAESYLRYQYHPDGFQHVWLARGIPYYYKYLFIKKEYPEEKWLPFSNTFIGRIFSLHEFDFGYQNQFLYLFLARQGLDQKMSAPADSLTRLNYESVSQAKAYLSLNHFRGYAGERNFVRAMHRFTSMADSTGASPDLLQGSFDYYLNRDTHWFFNTWIHSAAKYDYKLSKAEYCPTVATVRVKNKGQLNLPFSITGFKDGEPVLTEWFEGHEGKVNRQMYHEKYDKVVLNQGGRNAEFDLSNNTWYNRWLFTHLEPVKLQFYNSFENPEQSQLFWLPTAGYNAYDKLLLGISFYNSFLIKKPVEWVLSPEYSTGQNQLTGSGSLEFNLIPKPSGPFHRIMAGIYGRYFHYDQNQSYLRLSPGVNFYFRKPYPRSTILQNLRLRAVMVDRELNRDFTGEINDISTASYTVLNATHSFEETNLLHPYSITTDLLAGQRFGSINTEVDLRWMLPNKKWLIWRNFGGFFFYSQLNEFERNYYSLGLSGTQDYLFDYTFIGRSDETGIWSQQFFVTDGGFKSQTGVFANDYMLASNLSIPIYSVLGVYADIGWADSFVTTYYDYGFRLAFLTDFAELYLPAGNWQGLSMDDHNYLSQVRFVLNLDLSGALKRLRRGFY